MGMNRKKGGGRIEGSLVELGKEGEIADRLFRIQVVYTDKLKRYIALQGNLNTFIASIYMESRKVLKERMRIVCCLCYGKGEYPEKEVMQMVEVTTRLHKRSPRAHLLCLNREKDPQPENLGTLKLFSSSSQVGSPSHW